MTERELDLQNAIMWLRKELQEMKLQDKNLARQMINLRTRIKNMMKVDETDVNESDPTESFSWSKTLSCDDNQIICPALPLAAVQTIPISAFMHGIKIIGE